MRDAKSDTGLMMELELKAFHQELGGRFVTVNGAEAVADYGSTPAECQGLRQAAGILDLSSRSRLCLTGADRVRFLHGQVTNDVKALATGEGCYAALVTAKGKMQSDLNIFCLAEELLLDFEPGYGAAVTERLEKYVVADDVQVVDVSKPYGLLSVQGPKAADVIRSVELLQELPAKAMSFCTVKAPAGDIYVMDHPRLGSAGFDVFAPAAALRPLAEKLFASAKLHGGVPAGWQAFEMARIEAGIPRFGVDMDESNIPLECGIETRAVSYTKGCYIGQEVLNRIHTLGHVNQELRRLRLEGSGSLPAKGDKLFMDGKAVGYITSAVFSDALQARLALGYVRRECNRPGTKLKLSSAGEIELIVAAEATRF